MWKNNRPDGWEDYKPSPYTNDLTDIAQIAYEAGADAMLEGLKKGGVEYHTWMGREASNVAQYVQQTGGIPDEGWLVFIPEK